MHIAPINGAVKYAVKTNLSPPVHNAYNGCSCSTFVPVTSHNAKADLNSGQAFKLPTLQAAVPAQRNSHLLLPFLFTSPGAILSAKQKFWCEICKEHAVPLADPAHTAAFRGLEHGWDDQLLPI